MFEHVYKCAVMRKRGTFVENLPVRCMKKYPIIYFNKGTHAVLVMCNCASLWNKQHIHQMKHCGWNTHCILAAVVCCLQRFNRLRVAALARLWPSIHRREDRERSQIKRASVLNTKVSSMSCRDSGVSLFWGVVDLTGIFSCRCVRDVEERKSERGRVE